MIIDVSSDIIKLRSLALESKFRTAGIVLGGGIVKHHILNADIFGKGMD